MDGVISTKAHDILMAAVVVTRHEVNYVIFYSRMWIVGEPWKPEMA